MIQSTATPPSSASLPDLLAAHESAQHMAEDLVRRAVDARRGGRDEDVIAAESLAETWIVRAMMLEDELKQRLAERQRQ